MLLLLPDPLPRRKKGYFALYLVETNEKVLHPRLTKVGVDSLGNTVYKRAKPALVRFSDFHPAHCPEHWAYTLLCRRVPFRDEKDLLDPTDLDESYLQGCHYHGLLKNEDDVVRHVARYMRRNMITDTDCSTATSAILQRYDLLGRDGGGVGVAAGPDAGGGGDGDTAVEREIRRIRALGAAEFVDVGTEDDLEEDQLRAMRALLAAESGLHLITGGPGCGKTFLTKFLARAWCQGNKTVILTATTGAAATRLSRFATTVHSAFHIPAGKA